MKTYEVNGTYGYKNMPGTVLVAEQSNGNKWYVVEGSVNVNLTPDEITDGVNVEELSDIDTFTWSAPIYSLDDLVEAIEG